MLACNARKTRTTARNCDFVNGRGETLTQRLERSSQKEPNGCWLWTAFRDPAGYGRVQWNGNKSALAHRLALESTGVELGTDDALHSCDNRACVNPAHLRRGTHQDNMRDRTIRFRNGSLKLDQTSVECLRVTYATGVFTQKQLAKWWGITVGQVHNIVSRKHWSHVP